MDDLRRLLALVRLLVVADIVLVIMCLVLFWVVLFAR